MERRGFVVACLLAVSACTGHAGSAGAAGLPAVTTPSDLGSLIADPPTSDFVPIPEGLQGSDHFGTLKAATIVAENGNDQSVLLELNRQQFTRGYRKGWVQRNTGLVLIEKIEEFRRNSGASDHLARAKVADQASKTFAGLFDTPGLAQSYGVRIVESDGFETDSAVFTKGNLLAVVALGNDKRPSSDQLLGQARKQYDLAPAETIDQASATTAGGSGAAAAMVIAGGAGLLLVLAIVVAVILVTTRRPGRAPLAVQPLLSADGRYWWDGAAWRDTEASAPISAPRSPDGVYWFDGQTWRPVPRPGL